MVTIAGRLTSRWHGPGLPVARHNALVPALALSESGAQARHDGARSRIAAAFGHCALFAHQLGYSTRSCSNWKSTNGSIQASLRRRLGNAYKVALYLNCAGLDWERSESILPAGRPGLRIGGRRPTRWGKFRSSRLGAGDCLSRVRS